MFERLLEPNSTEAPACACGKEMRLIGAEKKSEDAAVKHFECEVCGRELMLMVWPEAIAASGSQLEPKA